MCFIRSDPNVIEREGGLRPLDFWIKTAEQLREMGTLFILLTGGEPLLYPQFKNLYEQLRNMGFIITLNTNGTLIDEETVNLFERLKPRRVNVTLYGSSNETYDSLCHNPHGYEHCLRGLRLLKERNIDTKMNVSLVRRNVNDYDDIMRIAQEFDIPAEVVCYMYPDYRPQCGQRDICGERLAPEDAARMEMQFMHYRKGADFDKYIVERKNMLDNLVPLDPLRLECRAGSTSSWIDWQGIMTPCVSMPEPRVSLLKHDVKSAWEYIVDKANQLPPHEECRGCRLRSICDVCYEAATEEKKMSGSLSHLCKIAEAKRNYINSYVAAHWSSMDGN